MSRIPYFALPALALAMAFAPAAQAQNADLVVWYPLDETSGTVCADASGNGHTGTYFGGTLGQPGAAPGSGTSVEFDGATEKVDIPDGGALTTLRQSLTATCWMKADQFSGVQRFFGNDGSWTWGLVNQSLRFTTRTIQDYDQPVSLSVGTWYHVAAVFDASFDVTFYVDGVDIGTVPGTAQANPPFATWHIAYKDPANPEWFDGHLDDVQVYDGVLSAADVKWLHEHPGQELARIGDTVCASNANSTGSGAEVVASGSVLLADDDVTLEVTGLPPGEMGYFVMGKNGAQIPVSQGVLCIGAPQIRFAKSPLGTGSGSVSFALDLLNLPQQTVFLPGETWILQMWYTDQNPGPVWNFSDAVAIPFQ